MSEALKEHQEPNKAVFTMHCPSGATNACVQHARQIEGLFGRIFGMRVQATAAPEGVLCDNCVNAAKAAARVTPSQAEGMDSTFGSAA